MSATLMMVPSSAATSSPRQRASAADGPRSSKNSSRSGPGPSRRRAWAIADVPGAGTPRPSSPAVSLPQTFESRPGQVEFYCNSFWNGTSGGPLITNFDPADGTGTVVGEIGGYQQGGNRK